MVLAKRGGKETGGGFVVECGFSLNLINPSPLPLLCSASQTSVPAVLDLLLKPSNPQS